MCEPCCCLSYESASHIQWEIVWQWMGSGFMQPQGSHPQQGCCLCVFICVCIKPWFLTCYHPDSNLHMLYHPGKDYFDPCQHI